MKVTFVRVTRMICDISSEHIVFEQRDDATTTLLRKHNGLILWKLTKNGIFVRREYAEAYKLI